jgi:NRPS condensation-like uncharacterized protein
MCACVWRHQLTGLVPVQRHFNAQFFTRSVLYAIQAMRALIRRRVKADDATCLVREPGVSMLHAVYFD